MKEKYIGYYKKTPDELKALWDAGLISFDANVLLNFYRYSTTTRKEILKLINRFSKKIFLTHQAGLEFHRNRFEVISEQEKIYKDFTDNIIKIEDELSSKSRHPFLSNSLQQNLNSVLNDVKKETEANEKYYCNLIINDEIYESINTIFNGKVENEYTEQELTKIYEEGKKRFEKKIPPGFEDGKEKEGNRIYGDLVLWKQIIDKAKREQKPVILVTDERKKDWWWKLKNGKTIGPRQELVDEIKKEANIEFHLYSTEKFVEYGLSYLKEKSNPNVVLEVKELREEVLRNKEREYEELIQRREHLESIKLKQEYLEKQLFLQRNHYFEKDDIEKRNIERNLYSQKNDFLVLQESLDSLLLNKAKLINEIEYITRKPENNPEENQQIHRIIPQLDRINHEISIIKERIKSLPINKIN